MLFKANILLLKGNIIQVPLFSFNFDLFVTQWLILDTDLKWKTSLHYCLIAGNIFFIKEQIHFYEEQKIVFPEKIGKCFYLRHTQMLYRKVCFCMGCLLFHVCYHFVQYYYILRHYKYCDNLGEYIKVCYSQELLFHPACNLLIFILPSGDIN